MTEAPRKMCDTCGAPVTQNQHGEISYDDTEAKSIVANTLSELTSVYLAGYREALKYAQEREEGEI